MIVPYTKKVKKIVIPHWLPKAMVLFILTFFIVLGLNLTYQENLKRQYKDKTLMISVLEEEGIEKDQELANLTFQMKELQKTANDQLQQKMNQVEMKLTDIENLQKKLEEMAGIQAVAQGGGGSKEIQLKAIDPLEGMEVLNEVLVNKEIELEQFIKTLENQFEYLESVPNFMPTAGRQTSNFGNRRSPFSRRIEFHQGIDIANARGTDIVSAGKGIVLFSGYNGGYGQTVIIDHGNEYRTLYAHHSRLLVEAGEEVEKGQVIGKMGSTGRSTGSHLHFEIHHKGKPINPLDLLQ